MQPDPLDRVPMPPASWAVVCFLCLAVVCTWPLARDMRTHVQDRGDPLLEIALLSWATDAAHSPGRSVFDAPQFYPYHDTQVYQNSFLGQVPLFAPVYLATHNPVLAFEVTLLATLVLSGVCMWGYVRAATRNSYAGLLAGVVFAFHQYRFRNLQHVQVMSIWWWPLAVWALEDFLATRRWRSVLALGVAGVAQLYCSIYMGLMLLIIVVVRCLVEIVAEPTRLADRVLWRRGVFTLLYGSLALAPLVWAYVRVARQFPPVHDMDAIVQFSAAPRDYLRAGLSSVPYFHWRAGGPWTYTFDQHVLFPGLVASLLTLYGLVMSETVSRRVGGVGGFDRRRASALVLAATVGVILSFGPYLKLQGQATDMPMPALALFTHVPGYGVFRVNTRFAFLLLFALSVGAGRALATFTADRNLSREGQAGLCGLLTVLFLIENWNVPVPTEPVPVGANVPPVYAALAEPEAGSGPVLHVPFGRDLYEDVARVYYGLEHGRPMVNGYSTVEPPGYAQLATLAEVGPSPAFFAAAIACNTDTIVVHYDAMPPLEAERWRSVRGMGGVRVWRAFEEAVDVWRLEFAPPFLDHPQAALQVPALTAGQRVTGTMRFTIASPNSWRCPRPFGLRDATVTWQPMDSGTFVERTARVLVPLFVVWTQPMEAAVTLDAPVQPGVYTLRVDCGVAVAETRVRVGAPRAAPAE